MMLTAKILFQFELFLKLKSL